MALRTLRCAIEAVVSWHPRLYLEPHVVAWVSVVSPYSESPARFEVECESIPSRWLGKETRVLLEVSWAEDTAQKARRMRVTMQSRPLVELAAVALGLLLADQMVALGQIEVTEYGDRADYRSWIASRVLEISGTETLAELGRRHREKVAQALKNPFGWDAYVVVCAFSDQGHRIRFSGHRYEESAHGEVEG
jgi:hypothetical protein